MNFYLISGILVFIVIAVFYSLFISKSDEIPSLDPGTDPPPPLPNPSQNTARLDFEPNPSSHPRPDHSGQPNAADDLTDDSGTDQNRDPEPAQQYSLWEYFVKILQGIWRFIAEVLGEMLILGLFKLIWFLIRGFFMLLGRIFD